MSTIDISGLYGETPRGHLYIMSFVDWLTNWPGAYAVPDKRAKQLSNLILAEIFSRCGAPVQLVMDNVPENVNKIMTELSMNTLHVTTSPYHSQSNAKVKWFQRILGDILTKLCER